MTKKKTPTDINQLAKFITDQTTEEKPVEEASPVREKNAAAVALGRLGGLKGGKARAEKLTAKRRKEIAQNAAIKRWHKDND
ncbi:hypothetical protein M0R72_06625 [Candidatus Pacearchaeota archaeon]|jgi:hypothetical protein|nr:hypothetical protein [Candidatus Pacearchaeota archaeon]